MKVAMNSDKVALIESGWVASSALPNAYLRGMVARNTSVFSFLFLQFLKPFQDQPHYFRSNILIDDLVFVSVGACLQNEKGEENGYDIRKARWMRVFAWLKGGGY